MSGLELGISATVLCDECCSWWREVSIRDEGIKGTIVIIRSSTSLREVHVLRRTVGRADVSVSGSASCRAEGSRLEQPLKYHSDDSHSHASLMVCFLSVSVGVVRIPWNIESLDPQRETVCLQLAMVLW